MSSLSKWLLPLLVGILNIVSSFYYSSQIVKENQALNHYQDVYSSLYQKKLNLQDQLAQLQSIQNIDRYAQSQNLKPIDHTLKLNPSSP